MNEQYNLTKDLIAGFIEAYTPKGDNGKVIEILQLTLDINHPYPKIRFNAAQTQMCVKAYLGLIEPLLAIDDLNQLNLYPLQFNKACYVVIAYLQRLEEDENIGTLIDYLILSKALEKIEECLERLRRTNIIQIHSESVRLIQRVQDIMRFMILNYQRGIEY